MSTKAGTMGFSARPALFTFWTVAVSALAAAALILSAVALNVAGRAERPVTSVEEGSGTREAAGIGAPLWDAGKLEAMHGRVLAETVRAEGAAPLWDAGKLEAMQGRVLAETVRAQEPRGAVGRGQARSHAGPRPRRVAPWSCRQVCVQDRSPQLPSWGSTIDSATTGFHLSPEEVSRA